MAKFETVPIGELKHRLPAKLLPLVEEYRLLGARVAPRGRASHQSAGARPYPLC